MRMIIRREISFHRIESEPPFSTTYGNGKRLSSYIRVVSALWGDLENFVGRTVNEREMERTTRILLLAAPAELEYKNPTYAPAADHSAPYHKYKCPKTPVDAIVFLAVPKTPNKTSSNITAVRDSKLYSFTFLPLCRLFKT
jgi:hypothetical protein